MLECSITTKESEVVPVPEFRVLVALHGTSAASISITPSLESGSRVRRDAAQDSDQTSSSCHTVSGPDTGSPCIFPYIYNGVTHISCVELICVTQVDSSGVFTNFESGWGYCNDNCIPTITRPDLCTQELGLYMCRDDCKEM